MLNHPFLIALFFLLPFLGAVLYLNWTRVRSWFASFDTKAPAELKRVYNWRPQLPDIRDFPFLSGVAKEKLPASADLTALCPAVYDQLTLGDCVGNEVAFAIQFDEMKQRLSTGVEVPSRLFIYWNARNAEGTTSIDGGCYIRDAVKTVSKLGVCSEALWPYTIAKFATKPNAAAFKAALKETAVTYQAVAQTLDGIRGAVAAGFPVVLGITVYQSFESATADATGVIPMPTTVEKTLGGHCVSVVGFDDAKQVFKFRNSWNAGWGDHGYGYLPYAYLINAGLCSDLWVIQKVK